MGRRRKLVVRMGHILRLVAAERKPMPAAAEAEERG